MSVTLHLTQFFSTRSADIFDECDRLMDEMLAREESDPSVRDTAISADLSTGTVEVEVVADGVDQVDAEQAALTRIRAAVISVVQLEREAPSVSLQERDRSAELIAG